MNRIGEGSSAKNGIPNAQSGLTFQMVIRRLKKMRRNAAVHCLIILTATIMAGCVSPMNSSVASERIKGLAEVMSERRITATDAELVEKLMKDPDREVRIKAFDVFVKRQIEFGVKYEDFGVWIILFEYVHSDSGVSSYFIEKSISIITAEHDADVRAAMWNSLSQVCRRKDMGRKEGFVEKIICGRHPESLKKEYVKAVWSGKEFELLNVLGSSRDKGLRLIDDADVLELFMSETKKDNPSGYRYNGYEDAAKCLVKIDKEKYAKYALANSTDFEDVEIAVDVLDEENLLTVIVLKGLRDVTGTDNFGRSYIDRVDKLLKKYLRKVQTEKFIFKVLDSVKMEPTTARVFLNAMKDENWLSKALSDRSIVDKAVSKWEEVDVLHKYVDRVQKDDNLEAIIKGCPKLSLYALRSVKDQDFLYKVLLKNQSKDEVKKVVFEKLDSEHKKAYQKTLDDAAKAAWHEKFDVIIKKAEAGDVSAMREVADDAAERKEMSVAVSWYKKICEADKDDGYSCIRVGDCYAESNGAMCDLKEARKYYALALARGWKAAEYKHTLVSIQLEHPELYAEVLDLCSKIGYKPDNQYYYMYTGGKGFEKYKIFQVIPAHHGVLVQTAIFYDGQVDADRISLNKNLLFIETDEQYVDGDWLNGGVFLYAGRYTYQTTVGGSKSVHMFKEWKPAADLKTIIAREGRNVIGMFGVRFGVEVKDLLKENVGTISEPTSLPESEGGGLSFKYDYQGNRGVWDEFAFETGGEKDPTIRRIEASKSYTDETKALSDVQNFLDLLKNGYGIPTAKNPMAKDGRVWLQIFEQVHNTVLLSVKLIEKENKYHLIYSLLRLAKKKD